MNKYVLFFIAVLLIILTASTVSADENITGEIIQKDIVDLSKNAEDISQPKEIEITINENIDHTSYEYKSDDYSDDWYSDSAYVVMPKDATGSVYVKVNNTLYKSFDVKKDSKIDGEKNKHIIYCYFDKLTFGTYNTEVTYTGNYGTLTKNSTIDITYPFWIYTLPYGKNLYDSPVDDFIFFELPEDIQGDIKVYVDGIDIKYDKHDDKPGSVSRPPNYYDGRVFNFAPVWISDLSLSKGNHPIEIKYLGDDKYPAKSINSIFYLEKSRPVVRNQLVNSENNITFLFGENSPENISVYTGNETISYTLTNSTLTIPILYNQPPIAK